MSGPRRLSTADPGFEAAFAALLAGRDQAVPGVAQAVAAILAEVRAEGDAAVARLTARFDRLELTPDRFALGADEIAVACAAVPAELHAALDLAARRIEAFHRAQMPADLATRDAAGAHLGLRWGPLDAVGIYVPGGKAAYPSSVLMNAIPARVAGVRRIAMCVPAPEGVLNPAVLAAARRAGVTEIYRIGGAQAVAALAYGTATIAPVDRIVGPGNAYVAEAKRQVFGHVGIDSIAGPSEVLVIADATARPDWVAIDLLAQAEHDEAAQAVLVTPEAGLAEAVVAAVDRLLPTLPRAEVAGASWRAHGAVILVRDLDEAAEVANRLAPEHLELAVAEPAPLFARIRHAGAAFLGHHAPEALGDYVAGPNHVLPTSRTARFASGLSVFDFLKRTTWLAADAAALAAIGPAAVRLAEAEGLAAHALSVSMRL
ncbi:histidinol dehydrogenase [Elioraea sp.]|uniref:histidinol dehydrogenase n=1 Tax=Elioraea sp. TaxID=2185103 RepID=UPI0021DBFE71|nr:histidinol dehydrogenase [Elioraea sp.]GIX11660.1 MAG: histidinol dehydrogenase 1 [Elioraea sp.]